VWLFLLQNLFFVVCDDAAAADGAWIC
ncbi:hypothetical protein L195_g013730, partial [Trifolium pratense]